jgi:hypothetical protein
MLLDFICNNFANVDCGGSYNPTINSRTAFSSWGKNPYAQLGEDTWTGRSMQLQICRVAN